jgi:hypothetical protein
MRALLRQGSVGGCTGGGFGVRKKISDDLKAKVCKNSMYLPDDHYMIVRQVCILNRCPVG